ncbi:MAG TPA: hypothetical protein VD993_13660 [Chitinophagaceae bacterium]|nr:hypothetical protein [Chitinophagaceae bacterium]
MPRKILLYLDLGFLTLIPAHPAKSQNPQPTTAIAYVKDRKEIRLINPDGTNDWLLWSRPRPDLAENQRIRKWIVFETGKSLEEKSNEVLEQKKTVVPELWTMRLDGSQARLLVKNGSGPIWGWMQ